MNKPDANRLRYMLDATREALSFASGKTRRDLNTDRMLLLALVKSIETIGEAASTVSDECQTEYADIPWKNIIATPESVTHRYFYISEDFVWQTVTNELPQLVIN